MERAARPPFPSQEPEDTVTTWGTEAYVEGEADRMLYPFKAGILLHSS